jgi:hypothetical protein
MITVDVVEDVACGLHRQCRYFRALTTRGDRRDTGGDEEAYRFELGQFIHNRIDLLCIRSFGV